MTSRIIIHDVQVANRACLSAEQFSTLLAAAKDHAHYLDARISDASQRHDGGDQALEDEWLAIVDVFDVLAEGGDK